MKNKKLEIVWQAASLLHTNGQTTQRVILDTQRLAHAYGLDIEILPQWDDIICRSREHNTESSDWQSDIMSFRPTGVDMNKVARTNQVIDRICANPNRSSLANIEYATQELAGVAALKPSSHTRFTLMAGFGAAALGVVFGVSNILVLALIFLTAFIGAGVRRALVTVSDNLFVQPFSAALIAGLMGGYAQHIFKDDGLQFIMIAPCMILVPGAHILNASLDLTRGRLGIGINRLMYCILILLAICAGLLLGLTLVSGTLASGMATAGTPLWLDIISAGVAVMAFGAFFSLPWVMLIAPVLVGMLCHGSRWLVIENGGGIALGTLVACIIAGTTMTLLSRMLKLPFAALAFASVVSMMPGIFIFKFADSLINIYLAGNGATLTMLTDMVTYGTAALLIVLVMTFGLILPKMLIEGKSNSAQNKLTAELDS
jgi:uncharacterized membrane protein YjjP (DUF1212 family)